MSRGKRNAPIVDRPAAVGTQRMFLVSRDLISEDTIYAVGGLTRSIGAHVLRTPTSPFADEDVEAMIAGDHAATMASVLQRRHVLVDPVLDDRPFGHLHLAFATALGGAGESAIGSPDAALQTADFRFLSSLVLVLAFLAIGVVFWAVKRAPRGQAPLAIGQLGLFSLLGFGFMLLEVVLVERASLVLGHPTIAFVAVMVALLVALCAGSLLSSRFQPETHRSSVFVIGAATLAVVVILPSVLDHAVPWMRDHLSAPSRPWFVSIGLIVCAWPLGVLLPVAFRTVSTAGGASATACWTANAATSVLGTVVAALLVRTVGFRSTAHLAGLTYLAAVLLWATLLNRTATSVPSQVGGESNPART
jgi:hypothetical protein